MHSGLIVGGFSLCSQTTLELNTLKVPNLTQQPQLNKVLAFARNAALDPDPLKAPVLLNSSLLEILKDPFKRNPLKEPPKPV